MVTSQSRGRETVYDGSVWRWKDSGEIVNNEAACSTCGKECVVLRLVVPADLSHTGVEREKDCGIDACIAPIVKALNDAGVRTRACCCGHGRMPGSILLEDGRALVVTPDFETSFEIVQGRSTTTIYGEPKNCLT